jgi:hypothetical protein
MSETLHKPLPVQGYTPQPDWKVKAVNDNRELEEEILRRLDDMAGNPEIDSRWVATARTYLELGFMALNRAVFQPQRVKLPESPSDETS